MIKRQALLLAAIAAGLSMTPAIITLTEQLITLKMR